MFLQEFFPKWNDLRQKTAYRGRSHQSRLIWFMPGASMQSPRRFLPSLHLLSAFEAAARTGSVTAAARELSLTQSAVSLQIKALEEQLASSCFTANARRSG